MKFNRDTQLGFPVVVFAYLKFFPFFCKYWGFYILFMSCTLSNSIWYWAFSLHCRGKHFLINYFLCISKYRQSSINKSRWTTPPFLPLCVSCYFFSLPFFIYLTYLCICAPLANFRLLKLSVKEVLSFHIDLVIELYVKVAFRYNIKIF